MSDDDLARWIETALGYRPADPALFRRALTHGSHGPLNYERLEFLGDRVLGLSMASWLFRRFPDEPEGRLSMRFNALVSRETCAEVGRAIGVAPQLILGKQARDDVAEDVVASLCAVVEALIGALFEEGGLSAAESFIHRAWADKVEELAAAPRHPKSALQEWAAAHGCRPPVYTLDGRHGPHHAPRFTVSVAVGGKRGGSAAAEGTSKQEAETAAAQLLLEQLA